MLYPLLYTPLYCSCPTVIRGNLDDSFSGIIDLPFKFCFYGQVYNQLVIGSNGMISFDTYQANQANPANFQKLYQIKIYLKKPFLSLS